MFLADLSEQLLHTAREKVNQFGNPENVKDIRVANALDLSDYDNESFDAVLLFGPLYHLTKEKEISRCLEEVSRVLKKQGKLIAIYIPWISGLTGIMERAFYAPKHVNSDSLVKTYKEGIFNNQSEYGFQEGSYIKTEKMLSFFDQAGFSKILLRSIRGIGYRQEKNIISLKIKT
jgi:ubiquinone/menaquinone biosynthesis C-methylase UbiE